MLQTAIEWFHLLRYIALHYAPVLAAGSVPAASRRKCFYRCPTGTRGERTKGNIMLVNCCQQLLERNASSPFPFRHPTAAAAHKAKQRHEAVSNS